MYRPLTELQRERRARKLEAMRRGKDAARVARTPQGRAPELPELRRIVTVTDYDSGQPVTHTLELLRSQRVDVYRVRADGVEWRCCGWSAALAALRKAYSRVPSARSDCWA